MSGPAVAARAKMLRLYWIAEATLFLRAIPAFRLAARRGEKGIRGVEVKVDPYTMEVTP